MRAKYIYNAGASQGNVLSDLIAILTGTTDVNSLSAACNKTTSYITSVVAAGWTVHDASAGSYQQVIKAPHAKNGALQKYVLVNFVNTGYVNIVGYETWDATGHTGTNATGNTVASSYQPINLTTGGEISLWASARFIALASWLGGYWGDTTNGGVTIAAEYTTSHPWSGSTVPDFAVSYVGSTIASSANQTFPVRAMDMDGIWRTGTNAAAKLQTLGWTLSNNTSSTNFPDGPNQRIPDGLGNEYVSFIPLWVSRPEVFGPAFGNISAGSDLWMPPTGLMGHNEIETKGGQNYIAVSTYDKTIGNSFRLIIRNE